MLDVANGSAENAANIQLYENNQTTAQRFNVVYGSDGYYTIMSVESGKLLDVASGSKMPAANVWQYASNNTDAQKWAIQKNADGSYSLVSKCSGFRLAFAGKAENGANMHVARQNSAASQKFKFTPVSVLADGTYTFYSKLAQTSQVLDITSASTAQNARVQSYAFNNSLAQRFVVVNLGDNVYTIQAVVSGKYLADSSGAVVQQTCKTATPPNTMRWKAAMRGGGVVFTNMASGKSMSLGATKASNGVKVQTTAYSGKAAEKFRPIKQSRLIAQGLYCVASFAGAAIMDVKDGSWKNGANIQTWNTNNSNAQKFAFIPEGNYWRIVMPLSANPIAVATTQVGSKPINVTTNTNLTSNGSQLWKLELTNAGLAITNKATNYALTVAGGKATNGANVQVEAATGALNQAWILKQTHVNSSDTTSLKNLVKNANNGSTPQLGANGRAYKVSSGAYRQLMNALGQAWNRGKYVDFIMLDADTGMTYALHADRKTYGASTSKAALVTYIYQELLEKGKVRNGDVYDLMYQTIVHSNNSTYATLYSRYAGAGYRSWLNSVGVGWVANSMYTTTTPRTLELMWTKILAYEESGGKYVGQWRKMYNKSDYSFIREAISGSNTVYSKPGWMFSGNYGTIHDDAAIVKDKSGRTYILAVMTNLQPDSQRWISKDVVKALNRIHNEMPAA